MLTVTVINLERSLAKSLTGSNRLCWSAPGVINRQDFWKRTWQNGIKGNWVRNLEPQCSQRQQDKQQGRTCRSLQYCERLPQKPNASGGAARWQSQSYWGMHRTRAQRHLWHLKAPQQNAMSRFLKLTTVGFWCYLRHTNISEPFPTFVIPMLNGSHKGFLSGALLKRQALSLPTTSLVLQTDILLGKTSWGGGVWATPRDAQGLLPLLALHSGMTSDSAKGSI